MAPDYVPYNDGIAGRSFPGHSHADRRLVSCLALLIGIAQGAYAFAPAAFSSGGRIRASTVALSASGVATGIFIAAALVQGLAICTFLLGRSR